MLASKLNNKIINNTDDIYFLEIYSLVKPLYKQSIQIVTNEKKHIFFVVFFEQRLLLYIEEINVLETFIVYLFIFFKTFF